MIKLKLVFAVSMLFFLLFAGTADAQQQRFRAGIVFGLNAAQISGDDVAGYNKLGLNGGLRAITKLQDKIDLVIGMLYSQRGSFGRYVIEDLKINLQYIEIPVMIAYKDWYIEDEDYYKVQAIGGFSYGRLLKASAVGSFHDAEAENFNDNDFCITLGADVFLNKHFGIGASWSHSLNKLYDNKKYEAGLNALKGYFLTFRGMYVF